MDSPQMMKNIGDVPNVSSDLICMLINDINYGNVKIYSNNNKNANTIKWQTKKQENKANTGKLTRSSDKFRDSETVLSYNNDRTAMDTALELITNNTVVIRISSQYNTQYVYTVEDTDIKSTEIITYHNVTDISDSTINQMVFDLK